METLNKNWFAFTLIAVIFGLLGFVIGRQAKTHKTSCPMMESHHGMMKGDMSKMHMFMMKDHDGDMEWIENEEIQDIKVEKEEGENGEKRIKVRIKKKEE